VKHLKIIFRTIFLLFAALLTPHEVEAQEYPDDYLQLFDSVEVSLLTCQPHDEVYSLYGHTALRWHDLRSKGIDIAFNWGVFNFKAPYFTTRFVFGLTDYELGSYPYHLFQDEYRHFGSMVTEQVLNLSNEEIAKLQEVLAQNLQPQNRVYRYNYFYNNCTTKARDVIEQCINGKIEYAGDEGVTTSYREMVHEMTRNNPWSQWGNDLLLGIQADQPTTQRQQEFLPNKLMYDFDHAQIYENGVYRPLVKERRIAVPSGVQVLQQGFPLSPLVCFSALLAIGLILFIAQWKQNRVYIVWEALLMVASGIIGIILFLMLFSQHPTVNINLQFILFNPIHWFFLWPVIKGHGKRYWQITTVLCLLFLFGACFQSYASGIWSLALCLLLQSILHLFRKRS
jgi:hypothetical protein